MSELSFRIWYSVLAKQHGLNPDPDDPKHFYDYRAAYEHGAMPNDKGHWPSEFKKIGHPTLIIRGIDTRTGKRAPPGMEILSKTINRLVMRQP